MSQRSSPRDTLKPMSTHSVPAPYRAVPGPEAANTGQSAGGTEPAGADAPKPRPYAAAPEPLPVSVYDNHTHLDMRLDGMPVPVAEALDAAQAVGVKGAVQVGCDLESSRFVVQAVEQDDRLLGAVALHPNDAPLLALEGTLEAALAEIEQLAQHPRVRAIGETGLDYFRTEGPHRANQQYSFRRHLDIATRLGLAVQIHDRDAHDDVVQVLNNEPLPQHVVFHCFSGDEQLAKICNDNGWYMSFSGTLTFKNAANLRSALAVADPQLLMVETDSPFLTPHPHRGRQNASYMVPYTVRTMAELLELDLAELCTTLAQNTETVYGTWSPN